MNVFEENSASLEDTIKTAQEYILRTCCCRYCVDQHNNDN